MQTYDKTYVNITELIFHNVDKVLVNLETIIFLFKSFIKGKEILSFAKKYIPVSVLLNITIPTIMAIKIPSTIIKWFAIKSLNPIKILVANGNSEPELSNKDTKVGITNIITTANAATPTHAKVLFFDSSLSTEENEAIFTQDIQM